MKWVGSFFFILILALLFKGFTFVQGISFQDLEATIKISVCGDGKIEGDENCEGDNLNNQTCESLGYGSGTLTCDIACSFDTYGCLPAPTTTPTPFSSTHQTIPQSDTTTSSLISSLAPTPFFYSTPKRTVSLPQAIIPFDTNCDNIIEISELFESVRDWVDSWIIKTSKSIIRRETSKKTRCGLIQDCDLNRDNECNIVDFSILMYYVKI